MFSAIQRHNQVLLSAITSFDHSGAILSATETTVGDRTMAQFAEEMMGQYEGDYVPQESNVLNGYIALYHQIKVVMDVSHRNGQ